MAGQVKLCFIFLLVLHVSLVSCRHDYYHYFSKYVKGESPTESSPSSTTGISTSKLADISMPGLLYSENVISPKDNSYSSSNNDAYENYTTKPVVQRSFDHDDFDDLRFLLMVRYGLIIGGTFMALFVVSCCVGLLCIFCRKDKRLPGRVVSTNIPNQPMPSQLQPQIPQAVTVQHFPLEAQIPQNPPPYSTQPIQQQVQYPSTEHLLHQDQMQPMNEQQYQQPLPQGYSNPETVPTSYPTKY